MENDILDSLDDLGCELIQGGDGIEKALESGPKDPLYTKLVEWLSLELKALCDLEDHVNAITEAEDSSSFLLELSSFLKELGCPHKTLMEGPVNKRLASREDRLILLDFLTTELQAARMIHVNKGTEDRSMHVAVEESPTAADLKKILVSLGFSKPPPNVTPQQLFGKVETKVKEVASKAKVGNPLFSGVLSDKQWHMLEELQKQMDKEYRIRREMLLKRLDVTILSFKWAENAKAREDEIQNIYAPRRGKLTTIPDVTLGDLLAAREDLAYIEKTSSASVRKNTSTPLNKVVIGRVPDRGGRPSEQEPPPPEMPSWQQRSSGPGPQRGGGGFSRGRGGGGGFHGGERGEYHRGGGRIQGNWSQGQSQAFSGGWSGGDNSGGYQHQGLISGMQELYIQPCDPTTGTALIVAPPFMQLPSYPQYGPSHPPTYGSYVMSGGDYQRGRGGRGRGRGYQR